MVDSKTNDDLEFGESVDDSVDYYFLSDESDLEDSQRKSKFSEDLICKTLTLNEITTILKADIYPISTKLSIPIWLASLYLRRNKWNVKEIEDTFSSNPLSLLSSAQLIPQNKICFIPDSPDLLNLLLYINLQKTPRRTSTVKLKEKNCKQDVCSICCCPPSSLDNPLSLDAGKVTSNHFLAAARLYGMSCGHCFCLPCWEGFFKVRVAEALSPDIDCMETHCSVRIADDFILAVLGTSTASDKYQKLIQSELVKAHPRFRECTNTHCESIIHALEEPKARRVTCETCQKQFCFQCGTDYHAPTDCDTIKRWLQKCCDDSGTANYMAAHTKDCPKCGVCIEKNGGCNHMLCSKCQYSFCWVCLAHWASHSTQYYVCSKYRENVDPTKESEKNTARDYLKRYLFYYERWENHERSLRLEEQHYSLVQTRIQSKMLSGEGTWIDWQYLLTAAETLRKCRYTLKYTYPYAYFQKNNVVEGATTSGLSALFEYQQGLLEAEVEDLSWKISHAEITDKGELFNKMAICEQHRRTLLQEFL